MNPRIFKKLCKRASKALIASGYVENLDSISQRNDECPEICFTYKWEMKSYIGKDKHPKWPTTYIKTLDGTEGFGTMAGYYEPEWWDKSSLCMLRELVIDYFTDYGNFDEAEMSWPENKAPKRLRVSCVNAIRFYEELNAPKSP